MIIALYNFNLFFKLQRRVIFKLRVWFMQKVANG